MAWSIRLRARGRRGGELERWPCSSQSGEWRRRINRNGRRGPEALPDRRPPPLTVVWRYDGWGLIEDTRSRRWVELASGWGYRSIGHGSWANVVLGWISWAAKHDVFRNFWKAGGCRSPVWPLQGSATAMQPKSKASTYCFNISFFKTPVPIEEQSNLHTEFEVTMHIIINIGMIFFPSTLSWFRLNNLKQKQELHHA